MVYVLKQVPKVPEIGIFDELSIDILSYITYKTKLRFLRGMQAECVPLYSKFLKRMFGNEYCVGLNPLKDYRLIYNKVYDHPEGERYYSKERRWCKAYRLSDECYKAIGNSDFIPVSGTEYYEFNKTSRRKFVVRGNPYPSPLLEKVLDSYNKLRVNDDWVQFFNKDNTEANHGLYLHTKWIMDHIYSKTLSIRDNTNESKKSGRISHEFLSLPPPLRKYFTCGDKEIVEIDAKSLHVYLLATFITDPKRKNDFLQMLKEDFYMRFVDKNYNRDEIKRLFQIVLSGKAKFGKALGMQKWLEQEYPEIAKKQREILGAGSTLQMKLQQIEANLFVKGIFSKADFWILPMHDGVAVMEHDVTKALNLCNEQIEDTLGFSIPMVVAQEKKVNDFEDIDDE